MTRAEIFRNIATIEAVAENEEFVNALLKEAESLENEIKERIVNALENAEEGMTATEVANEVGITLAKATALLTQLVKAGLIKREVEKKVAHFSA